MQAVSKKDYLDFQNRFKKDLQQQTLHNYVYSYPSKRTYRKFLSPIKINDIWNKDAGYLNIYIHIPFCEYRCSYCTLFSTNHFTAELLDKYVEKICEQIVYYGKFANNRTLTSVYFGGGTPTILSTKQFEKIFSTLYQAFPKVLPGTEINIESTPERINLKFLKDLKHIGINRMSVGIQTLQPKELSALGRRHTVKASLDALNHIRSLFENFNVDLIYGLQGQTKKSWFQSLEKLLAYQPSVLSLYSAISRPLTKIQKLQHDTADMFMTDQDKYHIYDGNVILLKQQGYKQNSFSRFSKILSDSYLQETLDFQGVPLLGFGAGARSYKDQYHYGTDYAVDGKAVLEIIKDFLNVVFNDNYAIAYGIILNKEEQKRRYVILNLSLGKIFAKDYAEKFNSVLLTDFGKELEILRDNNCLEIDEFHHNITLTSLGFKFSNLIATLFYSRKMYQLEKEYQPK